jgi:hypothetical protein
MRGGDEKIGRVKWESVYPICSSLRGHYQAPPGKDGVPV